MKTPAVIYARYSSNNQTEQSIEGQLRDNYAFAEREGYKVVGEYIDRAKSGTTDNRENFQRMIADAARRKFEVVIVWKLDRFARNRYDSAVYKRTLKKYNVRVVSCMERITDSAEGIILEGLLEAMNEYYSANLSTNVKRGLRETLLKGRFSGGQVPYGYKLADGKLVPDELTAPVVQYLFEQYADGVPKKKIIDELKARGVKSPNKKEIGIATFQRVFTNPIYYGLLERSGVTVEDCVTPIITKELFDRVQSRLALNSRAPGAGCAIVPYALRGKAFCGECGATMVGDCGKSKTGTMYYYYTCAARKKKRACDNARENKSDLEKLVVEKTVNYVLTPSNMRYIAKGVVAEYEKEFSTQKIESMKKAVARIEREIEKAIDVMIDTPKSARPRVAERIENLENEKSEIEKDIIKIQAISEIRYTEEEVMAWLRRFCTPPSPVTSSVENITTIDEMPDYAKFTQDIIDVFVNSVYVYKNKIVIFYNITSTHSPDPTKCRRIAENSAPTKPRSRKITENNAPSQPKSSKITENSAPAKPKSSKTSTTECKKSDTLSSPSPNLSPQKSSTFTMSTLPYQTNSNTYFVFSKDDVFGLVVYKDGVG